MFNENSIATKFKKNRTNKKACCIVIRDEDKILLKKNTNFEPIYLYEFPKREISIEEYEVSRVFLEMKEKYGIKGKTKDRFICNIQHSYTDFDLMLYIFELQISNKAIDFSDELKYAEWFSISQIWNVPLAPPDVTLIQLLLECNEKLL